MANPQIFQSAMSYAPPADAVNDAGGKAYRLSPKHALAQLATTGCFNGTYYASAETQLDRVKELIAKVDDNTFLAKLAVYARKRAYMKDMPAALVATLAVRDPKLMHKIFHRVIDNGRTLRTLFQMIRSGQFGKRSLSYSLKRAFVRWFNTVPIGTLLSASIGNNPALRDVLRLARPKPKDNARRAAFGWLVQKPVEKWAPATQEDLPQQIRMLSAFREAPAEVQVSILAENSFRWDLLADSAKGPDVWKAIAKQMAPQALRMNLNTLERHGVLEDPEMVAYVATALADPEKIKQSRQFPYQYFAAYMNVSATMSSTVKSALHKAAEIACGNIPTLPGPVIIGLDVSGSMRFSITGDRPGAPSKVQCVDAAALFASAILRKNPDSVVIPFDDKAYVLDIDPGDTILSISRRLAKYGGGGTDCSLPVLAAAMSPALNSRTFAGIILISDNESWIDDRRYMSRAATPLMSGWQLFVSVQRKLGNRNPKLICIDLQPSPYIQAVERPNILNVGGFSDAVFNVVASFLSEDPEGFVRAVEAEEL